MDDKPIQEAVDKASRQVTLLLHRQACNTLDQLLEHWLTLTMENPFESVSVRRILNILYLFTRFQLPGKHLFRIHPIPRQEVNRQWFPFIPIRASIGEPRVSKGELSVPLIDETQRAMQLQRQIKTIVISYLARYHDKIERDELVRAFKRVRRSVRYKPQRVQSQTFDPN